MKDDLEDRAIDVALHVEEKIESSPYSALLIAETAPPETARHPEVRLAKARALAAARGAEAARGDLESLVRDEPDFAEARHELGLVYEELGEEAAQSTQMLEVRELDAKADEESGFDFNRSAERMIAVARRVMAELPIRWRSLLTDVPIMVEERPSEELVRERFDPRALGLFEGPDHGARNSGGTYVTPTRIVLYAANLAAFVDPSDEEELAAEIEITLLHEIGHYFGLDEDELEKIGLG
ncbi:MAG TPA: metallopeptidase family protein [Polyangiaceae bacterium]|nr:metallopeptidase family protein [Polyangiaceae bacterium]